MKSFFPTIKWAPIFGVSQKRRREAICTFLCVHLLFYGQTTSLFITYYLLVYCGIYGRSFIITYIIYIILDKSGDLGSYGQGIPWVRSLNLWKYFTEYFPMKIVKTAEIPPNKNYIFACHPHGIICFGVFMHFSTIWTGFNETFPRIKGNLCTIPLNFWHPFYRQLTLAWGVVTFKYKTMKYLLSQNSEEISKESSGRFTSTGLALLVGGAQEALLTQKNSNKIYVKNRKGFVKLAIETGASIVPVYSFGENDLYDVYGGGPGTFWRSFQIAYRKIFLFFPMIFNGRGLFQYSFGLMPKRVPITSVFGAPIDVVKNEKPTQLEINKLHEKYMKAIEELFEEHKWKYIKNPKNIKMVMV